MKTIIMAKGLPGSGKSFWSRDRVRESGGGYVRVSKDDIRSMLHEGKWSKHNEKLILAVRDEIIVAALQAGSHVIVDDTNFAPKHEERLRQLAKENGAAFEIEDFTAVPLEICIERDLKRMASVGEAVIRKMHRDFLAPKPPVIEYDPSLPDCIIVDVDGTVALMNGRGPYEGEKCDTDLPHKPVVDLVKRLVSDPRYQSEQVIFVSGRLEAFREKTLGWIIREIPEVAGCPLFMRADGDTRQDSIIKREIYEREIRGKYNVLWVLDDRNRVVAGWRALGLTCFQVAEGDF